MMFSRVSKLTHERQIPISPACKRGKIPNESASYKHFITKHANENNSSTLVAGSGLPLFPVDVSQSQSFYCCGPRHQNLRSLL